MNVSYNSRTKFTKWYVRKGYKFGYDFTGIPIYSDGFMKTPVGVPKAIWSCPWWVKPFLFLFSPSVYAAEGWGKQISDGFMDGLKVGMGAKEDGNNHCNN